MGQEVRELGESHKKQGARPTKRELLRLVESQKYRCALSGDELDPDFAALDHVNPVSKGGSHAVSNLQVITKTINAMKGTLSNDEFIAICKQVAQWNS
jgi:5-methylcytosine-specific restriction endonuclease McrA